MGQPQALCPEQRGQTCGRGFAWAHTAQTKADGHGKNANNKHLYKQDAEDINYTKKF